MAIQHRPTVVKTLIGVAFTIGVWVGFAAPAGAETILSGNSEPSDSQEFSALDCGGCHETGGHGDPQTAINQGMRRALGR